MARDYKDAKRIAIPVLTPDRVEKRQNGRRFKEDGEPMFTLTGQDRHGVAIEPIGVLRNVRTDYGKEIRKDYEAGNMDISRHEFLAHEVRDDGITNTLSTVQKDNQLACSIPVSMSRNVIEDELEVAHCLNANDSRKFFGKNQGGNAVMEVVGCINPQGRKCKKVVPRNEVPTLRSQSHGNEPNICIKVREATKQEYAECRVGVDSVNLAVPGSKTRRGRVGHDVSNTLDTSCNQGIFVQVSEELTVYAVWYEKYQCYIAIRKLTPKECFRLQGWADDYFGKAQFINSDSQLYKQAGNGVTVNVIEAIAKKMRIA